MAIIGIGARRFLLGLACITILFSAGCTTTVILDYKPKSRFKKPLPLKIGGRVSVTPSTPRSNVKYNTDAFAQDIAKDLVSCFANIAQVRAEADVLMDAKVHFKYEKKFLFIGFIPYLNLLTLLGVPIMKHKCNASVELELKLPDGRVLYKATESAYARAFFGFILFIPAYGLSGYKSVPERAVAEAMAKIKTHIERNASGIVAAVRKARGPGYARDSSLARHQPYERKKETRPEAFPSISEAEAKRLAEEDAKRRRRDEEIKRGKEFQRLLRAAESAFEEKRYDDTITSANDALKIKPYDSQATRIKQTAIAKQQAMLKRIENLLVEAQLALRQKRYDDAIAKAGEAQKIRPEDETARNILVKARTEKAVEEENQKRFGQLMDAASTLLSAGKYEEAIKTASEALSLKPGDSVAEAFLKEAQEKKGEKQKQEQVDKLLTDAKKALDSKEMSKAKELAEKALELQPGNRTAEAIRKESKKLPRTFTNSVGMKLVLIPAGEFQMGSPANEKSRESDEKQHRVKITKPFYMQTTEVTQAQWKAIMGSNPSRFKGDNLPVEQVSWNDVQEFLKKLSAKEGVKYRLPTEAEWEYACRAGSTTRFCFDDDDSKLSEYAWYRGNSRKKTHSVGQKKANTWGLYDMHGNVWEWCQDWYDKDYYKSPAEDPQGPLTGEFRVLRGGSWYDNVMNCRSAFRLGFEPVRRFYYVGFRVLRTSQ